MKDYIEHKIIEQHAYNNNNNNDFFHQQHGGLRHLDEGHEH
jgi:hypothetical protein